MTIKITKARLQHVSDLVEHALDGDYKAQGEIKDEIRRATGGTGIEVEESHSTSDFPAALQVITNFAFLGQYQQIQPLYPSYTTQYNVNDLRPTAFYSLLFDYSNLPAQNGGSTTNKNMPGGLPRVPELTEYPTFSFSATNSSFAVAKYGARVNFSFEMLLNDQWNALETLPTQLAQLARNQEDIVATEVLASATGPDAVTFNNTNQNIITTANGFASNNPVLSIDALVNAQAVIRAKKLAGNPVIVPSFTLMVPPALEALARRLLNISDLTVTDPTNGVYTTPNPIADVNLIVNPWLPVVDQSASVNTTWYLIPTGGTNGIRPAIVFSKIRGRETPELRISGSTGSYIGGGAVAPTEGSFLNDDIEYRVRHFSGAASIGVESMAVSKGTAAP
jgi:hypothetical protein